MEFKLNRVNGSYLQVNISGECTREEILDLPNRMKKYCDNNNCTGVLLDSNNINCSLISVLDQHTFGQAIADSFGPSTTVAILGNDLLFTRFLETVAFNRGANIKVSNNLDELLLWLKK